MRSFILVALFSMLTACAAEVPSADTEPNELSGSCNGACSITSGGRPPGSRQTQDGLSDSATSSYVPSCSDSLALVNKDHFIAANDRPTLVSVPPELTASGCVTPQRVHPLALASFRRMRDASGYDLRICSAYRSFDAQCGLNCQNRESLTRSPAGGSEHHCGLSVDVTWPGASGGLLSPQNHRDAEYGWLRNNASRYGFVLSYPADRHARITGYSFEPWHWRWVGTSAAAEVRQAIDEAGTGIATPTQFFAGCVGRQSFAANNGSVFQCVRESLAGCAPGECLSNTYGTCHGPGESVVVRGTRWTCRDSGSGSVGWHQ